MYSVSLADCPFNGQNVSISEGDWLTTAHHGRKSTQQPAWTINHSVGTCSITDQTSLMCMIKASFSKNVCIKLSCAQHFQIIRNYMLIFLGHTFRAISKYWHKFFLHFCLFHFFVWKTFYVFLNPLLLENIFLPL